MVNTKSLYLSILEVGLSCVAVNLPSLWFLARKVTPEDVLRSVRSIVSLQSFRSGGSQEFKSTGSSKSNDYVQMEDGKTSRPDTAKGHLARPDAIQIETNAVHDVESAMGGKSADVHVMKTFCQSSEHA